MLKMVYTTCINFASSSSLIFDNASSSSSSSSTSTRLLSCNKLVLITLLLIISPSYIASFAPIKSYNFIQTANLYETTSQNIRNDQYQYIIGGGNTNYHSSNKRNSQLFLFRRLFRQDKKNDNEDDEQDDKGNVVLSSDQGGINEGTTTTSTTSINVNDNKQQAKNDMTPLEKAQMLRAQAERTRLEAEKMDIMLTIQKIEKLEKELERGAMNSNSTASSGTGAKEKVNNQDEIKKQIDALKKKLNGDTSTSKPSNQNGGDKQQVVQNEQGENISSKKSSSAGVDSVVLSVIEEAKKKPQHQSATSSPSTPKPSLSQGEIDSRVQKFNDAPTFMQEIVVNAAGMNKENLNTTALIMKLENDQNVYNEQFVSGEEKKVVPNFTQEQIDEVVEAVKMVPQFVKNLYGDEIKNNDTAIALIMLEEEWKEGKIVEMPEITQKMIDDKLEEVKWVPQFLRGDNDTELALELIKMDFKNNPKKFRAEALGETKEATNVSTTKPDDKSSSSGGLFSPSLFGASSSEEERGEDDKMVESLFPKSTRREGEAPSEKDLRQALVEVFAKDNVWSVSGKPEQVPGGFIVRGVSKYDTGEELIEAIDKNLQKSKLVEKMNVFYVFDPTPVTEEQMEGGERPPVLFVTGPKVVRDAAPIQRSIISSLALGTVWYNSLIPYLLNDKYMKLADEQLALADASMTANLDFLNDLSFPLFVSILGIQIAHEIAHSVAAKVNGLEISFPTLIPSLEAGITGAITSLQSPPKNKQALFDFAIAGPLTGLAVSVVLMYIGMFLSSSMDAVAFSDLPALPLNLLRQSSLVGGILNSVSPGLLTIPDAALGSKALSDINIPLHPLTIAGYFGLMINAINLLPVGRTDGGRLSLTLFGRSGTQLVSLITFVGLFFGGILGSDLFLFFFSYVVFFQSELEVPQRNEVDDMDFSRVLLATATGVLVLLTLIPM